MRFNEDCGILGLPISGSWQDLKDHMREAGDVCYADTFKDGTGVVEFLRYEDMKYAVKKLDDSKFRSHEVTLYKYMLIEFKVLALTLRSAFQGETSYITVREDTSVSRGSGGRHSRSRSGSPVGGGYKRDFSPKRRSCSRSRSRSYNRR